MTRIDDDPASGEADLIDLRVQQLVERTGATKFEAYQELLSTPEGLRLLADLKMVQKRYDEEGELRFAAQRLEEIDPTAKGERAGGD
jgi:hypothetical protein